MNDFLDLQSKYLAKIQRNNNTIESLEKGIQETDNVYQKLRLHYDAHRLGAINLEYYEFIEELKTLEENHV